MILEPISLQVWAQILLCQDEKKELGGNIIFGQFETLDKLDLGGEDVSDWDAVASISTDSRETQIVAFNPNF